MALLSENCIVRLKAPRLPRRLAGRLSSIPTARVCMSSVKWRISRRTLAAQPTSKRPRWISQIISGKAVRLRGTANYGVC